MPTRHHLTPRYLEVDGQGVVFHMWYLAWFDDAMTTHLAAGGLPYGELLDAGFDCQVVHTELDYRGGVAYRDEVTVVTTTGPLGRTSFTLDFAVQVRGETQVTGRTVYVLVATDGTGKCELTDQVRAALAGGT